MYQSRVIIVSKELLPTFLSKCNEHIEKELGVRRVTSLWQVDPFSLPSSVSWNGTLGCDPGGIILSRDPSGSTEAEGSTMYTWFRDLDRTVSRPGVSTLNVPFGIEIGFSVGPTVVTGVGGLSGVVVRPESPET